MKRTIVHSNQRVITATGETKTVAFVRHGIIFVYGSNGIPMPATICGDAWGGEMDQTMGLAA